VGLGYGNLFPFAARDNTEIKKASGNTKKRFAKKYSLSLLSPNNCLAGTGCFYHFRTQAAAKILNPDLSRAVEQDKPLNRRGFQIVCGMSQSFTVGMDQMKTADHGTNRNLGQLLFTVFKCVNDPGVTATVNENPFLTVGKKNRLFINDFVRHVSFRIEKERASGRLTAVSGNRACQKNAGSNLSERIDLVKVSDLTESIQQISGMPWHGNLPRLAVRYGRLGTFE
jgi:hypothetical protein